MIAFLLTFLAIYGSANFYCFWKLRLPLRGQGWAGQAVLGVFVLLMVLGPFLVRTLEKAEWFRTAWLFGLIAYIWMGLVLWFLGLGLLTDLWNGAVWALGHVWPVLGRWALTPQLALAAIGAILLVTATWSLVEAQRVRVERLTLKSPILRPGERPIRIVQISDLHLGLLQRQHALRRVLALIDQLKPDLLLSTGDLVDGTADHMGELADILATVRPPLGKLAVIGNHEIYAGLAHSLDTHRRAGFRVLRGEAVEVGPALRVAGVDDPAVRGFRGRGGDDGNGGEGGVDFGAEEMRALAGGVDGRTTLLLKHRPEIAPASVGRFALQLSGHTHKGQIFPFNLLVRQRFRRIAGYYPLTADSALYVSRGTGTWGPPMRLGSPPEVTLITVEPKK